MKLIAFGDSFVQGLLKSDAINSNSPEEQKEINFVTQLQKLDNPFTSVENYGVRGYGTEAIAYEVYKRLQKPVEDCFFLIVWSGAYRVGNYHAHADRYQVNMPKGYIEVPKNYIFQLDMHMEALSSLLKKRNIPYAYTNSFSPHTHESLLFDESYFESLNYINATYKRNTLFDIIAERYGSEDTNYEGGSNHTMFDVPISNLIAPCKHPTALGHKLIAKTLNNPIKKIIDNHV